MKYSITRALAELKRIDDRIQKAMQNEFIYVAVGRGTNRKVVNRSEQIQQFESKLQSNRDSLDNLFSTRNRLKAAIVQSNATTFVTLGSETLTVAEAIERKKSIEMKQHLMSILKNQLVRNNELVNTLNEKLNLTIETNLNTIYGNEKGKVDPGMYSAIAEPQLNQKEASLIDPNSVSDWISELDNEISLVTTELDFLLSESNSRTEIDV
jgi:hypothetical protein